MCNKKIEKEKRNFKSEIMSYNTFHESLAIPRVTSESTNSELDELWTDILGKHWRFVESDENLEKIERRKEFEGDFYILLFYPHSEQKNLQLNG